MNKLQEKRALIKAFNQLTQRRTKCPLFLAVPLWQINGLSCAPEFIAKMQGYGQANQQRTGGVS